MSWSKWCANIVTVTGSPAEVSGFMAMASRGAMQFSFRALYPPPRELAERTEMCQRGTTAPVVSVEECEWRREHWGVRHEPFATRTVARPGYAEYWFSTRGDYPTKVLLEASRRCPGLRFSLTYGDPLRGVRGTSDFVAGQMLVAAAPREMSI
jgi:hypothetical protein